MGVLLNKMVGVTHLHHLAKGPAPSGLPRQRIRRFASHRAKGRGQKDMKAEKAQSGAGLSQARQWLTLRVSAEEKQRVEEQAALAGLSLSEYMRRTVFGGRPVVAAADEAMLRELRRVGGLLKHHFTTVQQAGLGEGIADQMSDTLRLLSRSIEVVSSTFRAIRHDR